MVAANPPPIVGSSHDPLLQWSLNESQAGLAILSEGSEAGYRRFLKGEVVAARSIEASPGTQLVCGNALGFRRAAHPLRDEYSNVVA